MIEFSYKRWYKIKSNANIMDYKEKYLKYKSKYFNLKNIQFGGVKSQDIELQDIRNQIVQLMEQYDVPGLSLSIVSDYKIVFCEGFGVKDKIQNDKITTNTQFQAGSVSKPIFALGVMLLHNEKKVDIDEDIAEYLTSWKVPDSHGTTHKLTLRSLLTHTAGTTVHGFPGYNIKDTIPSTVDILNGNKPSNTDKVIVDSLPGIIYDYSGGGITIAQLAVTDKLNKDFPEIMYNLIFKKLNLNCSYQQPINEYRLKNYASGHIEADKKIKIVDGNYHIYPEMAAAGLWSSSEDLAKIGIEVCKALKNKSSVFPKKIINEMMKPHIILGEDNAMGIGFFLNIKQDIFSHSGVDEGYVTQFTFSKDGKGYVIMINLLSRNGFAFMKNLRNTLNKILWNQDPDPLKKINKAHFTKYVGIYKSSHSDQKYKIKFKNNNLVLNTPDYKIELYYDDYNKYFRTWQFNIIVEFRHNAMYIYQCGTKVEFAKV